MLRRLAWGFIFAIAPLVAFGQTYGRMEFSLQNAQGQAISGASINVYTQTAGGAGNCGGPAGPQAQLFHTSSGQPMIQPLHTDGFGHNYAYMVAGLCYTVTYNSPSTGLLTYVDQAPQYAGTGGPPGPQGPPGTPGTAGNPAPPAFAIQFANTGVTQFQGDTTITANPTTHTITAPNTSSSVNAVLFVKSYGALCDGSTDDTTAIQAAFTDAYIGSSNPLCTTNGCSIQFPAGVCVSGAIVWKGQPFFGAGITATTIKGKPGQDVFATPDGVAWTAPIAGTLVHDLKILVDVSVDDSASGQRVVSATVNAGGSGGTDGTQIVTGTTGTGGFFQATVTVSGGAITAVLGIYNSGFYTTNPTVLSAEPVTGAGVSGATLSLTMGSAGGNNTFPNRIAGTLGGTALPISPAISPGPEAFGPTVSCSGTISGASLGTITFSGAFCATDTLDTLDSWRIIGAPITINGVGPAGANLITTIASVTGPNTVTLTTPATSSGSSLAGTYLNPVTPPYYIGNCGIAFPQSNGSGAFSNIQNFQFNNVQIISIYAGIKKANHACGMFVQAPPYEVKLEKVQIQNFWGGYIEAKPAINPGARTWTGDTSTYKDIDLQINMIPLIIMGGNHRNFSGINVYGGAQHQALGPMWLDNTASATVGRMYFECATPNTGEISRYSGGAGINIQGGGLDQCNGANSYVSWNASNSTVSADIRSMHIASGANHNNISAWNLQAQYLQDNGFGNTVTSNGGTNPAVSIRVANINRPRPAVGLLDGSYLLSGSASTPYLNASDLIITCLDMGVMFNQPSIGTCNPDPTGTELSERYFQSAGATTIVDGISNGGVPNIWSNYPRVFGTHIPTSKVNVYIRGEAVGASSFTAVLLVKDGTTNAALCTSGTLTFGATWTAQSILNCDLTGATVGDQLDFRIQSVTNAGTNYRIASIEIQPINQDLINYLSSNGIAANVTLTTTATTTVSGSSGFYYNQDATAATAVTYTLPTPVAGAQFCIKNDNSGGTPDTGTVKIITANTGTQQISCLAGCSTSAITASGFIQSSGAAGDGACVVAKSTTQWDATISAGVWAIH